VQNGIEPRADLEGASVDRTNGTYGSNAGRPSAWRHDRRVGDARSRDERSRAETVVPPRLRPDGGMEEGQPAAARKNGKTVGESGCRLRTELRAVGRAARPTNPPAWFFRSEVAVASRPSTRIASGTGR